jgi:uncharacterized membrane protein
MRPRGHTHQNAKPMSILAQFFAWPNGQIWGNVVAEPVILALTLLLAGKWIRKAVASHRRMHAKLDALHQSHVAIHAKLDSLPDDHALG